MARPKLRTLALIICSIVVILALFVGMVYRLRAVPPLENLEQDLGKVSVDSDIYADFDVKNRSLQSVRIEKIRPACSCTVATGLPTVLEGRRKYRVRVKITVGEREARSAWPIAIDYAGGRHVDLIVRATVVRPFPKEVYFGEHLRGDPETRAFKVETINGAPLDIQSVQWDKEFFSVQWKLGDKPSTAEFTVAESRDIPYGGFDKQLIVRAGKGGVEERIIPLRGKIALPITIDPPRVNFGLVTAGKVETHTVRLRAPYGGRISGVQVYDARGIVTMEATATRQVENDVILTLKVGPTAKEGLAAGILQVGGQLDGAKQQSQILPYYVNITR